MENEKFSDELNQELFLKYAVSKDTKIRNKIVVLNTPLVSYIISKQYANLKLSQEIKQDLLQEGIMGLLHSVEKYKIDLGFKLSTYCSWWIKQKINTYLSRNTMITIPNHIRAEQNKLYQELKKSGIYVKDLNEDSPEELKKYNLTSKKLQRIQAAINSKKIVSIHTPIWTENDFYALEDIIEDSEPITPELMDNKSIITAVKIALKEMPEKKRLILLLRYGVINESNVIKKEDANK